MKISPHVRHSLPYRVYVKLEQDGGFNYAVILAWNFLQSLFPIVLVMMALLGVMLGYVHLSSSALERMLVSIVPDSGAQAQLVAALDNFHNRSGLFFVVGFGGLVWSGSNLFRSMESAFANIYKTRLRPWGRSLAISILMMGVFTILAGIALLSSFLLSFLNSLSASSLLHNGYLAFSLQVIVGLISGVTLFGCIYYVIPRRRMKFRQVMPGALLSGVLFEVLALLFPLYIALSNTAGAYGKTFGLLFLLMAYFYFLGLVTMVGVEVNSILYPLASPLVAPAKKKQSALSPAS